MFILSYQIDAQTNSFYSQFGIGEINYAQTARSMGLGNLGIAIEDRDFLSVLNPASWNQLRLSRIELSGYYRGLAAKDNTYSNFFSNVMFSSFTFGLPLQKDYGISAVVGLIPYSTVSYESVLKNQISGADNYDVSFQGDGGLAKIFLGASYRLPFNLSLGATFDYYFGNLNYTTDLEFQNKNSVVSIFKDKVSLKGLGTTIGVITPDLDNLFGKFFLNNIKLGITANVISKLTTDIITTRRADSYIDTINIASGKAEIPLRLIFGLSFSYNKSWQFYLDYMMQNWSNFKLTEINNPTIKWGSNSNIVSKDVKKINFGFEYRPNIDGMTFEELVIYRMGIGYENAPFSVNGKDINQISISAGVSLPLGKDNTVDFAIQYFNRGSAENGLVKENIINLAFGLSFGELWFIRQDK